nr:pitrilysin family protein [Tissierella sp.]
MYFIKKLDNGIQVVLEKIGNINSISLGVIVDNGSINEIKINNGISHFIEHMLFRGTNNKTSKQISEIIDKIGGNLNAYTSKENTGFYAQILPEHLEITIDLLSDMMINPLFNEEDIEKEKSIIEEEINMYLDDPEDLVHELLNETIYANTSLEMPILGNLHSIKSFNNIMLKQYFQDHYNVENIIISIAGNIDIEETYKNLDYYFADTPRASKKKENIFHKEKNKLFNKIKGLNRDIEQFNLCIGLPGVSSYSQELYEYLILSNILANNESSRLYQSIREAGFAYSIYSSITSYRDKGDMAIYMGLNNTNIDHTLSLIDKEFYKLLNEDISKEEIELGKEQIKINYILESENSLSKMFENAKSFSLFGKIETQKEILEKIEKVNKTSMKTIVLKTFNREYINVSYVTSLKDKININQQINNKIFRGD